MAAILLLLSCFIPILGVLFVKSQDQAQRDADRKTYQLAFPAELDEASITAWIRSITGTLRIRRSRFVGVPTVAFEMWATNKGIRHRMKVPWQHADYIISQLRSLVPGIRVTPEDEWPSRQWTTAVEVGLTHTSRSLRIYDASVTSASLLASVQAMEEDEAVIVQWVVTPAVPSAAPIHKTAKSHHVNHLTLLNGNLANRDEVKDRRSKLEEPNVLAVLRVAAVAGTEVRATHLIHRVRASLASTRSASTRFRKRLVSKPTLQRRIDTAAGMSIFPMQLSAPELTALLAWPIGNPHVSGLPPAMSRHLPASDLVPAEGRVIGRSNMPGSERPIAMGFDDARKHVHVLGPTGVGKTILLSNMLRQDVAAGFGVVLIESKGDLFHAALDYIPKDRYGDVIVLDVMDNKYPLGFNILNQGDPRVVVDEVGALFDHLYKDTRNVWTREILYHGLQTLITDPRMTFVDLAPLLSPMTSDEIDWAQALKRSVKDQELRLFWQRFDGQPRSAQDRYTQPVMDRIWQLNARPEIRHVIGQSESSFTMPNVVRENKILLINLSGLPKDTATLTGTLLMNSLWHSAKTTASDKPTFLYLDEFQDFTNLPIDPSDMLAKSRSFGLGMTLAHQHLAQLPNEMRSAINANARSKIVFQTTIEDAKVMSREFGNAVDEHDFLHLGRFEALARVATPDGVSAPLTLTTIEPFPSKGSSRDVIALSRLNYGRQLADVERDIVARRTPEKAPKTRRPQIGSDEPWGIS